MKPAERSIRVLLALMAVLGVVCVTPTAANAAFTRQFVRQITGTCETPGESPIQPSACPHSKFLPFGSVGGVAVDEKDDLWVGDLSSGALDEFSPAYLAGEPNAFLKTLPIKAEGPLEDVAIERASTGDFYVTHHRSGGSAQVEVFSEAGAHVETWTQSFDAPYVAIDNATESVKDPSACGAEPLAPFECFVYVAAGGVDPGVGKFNAHDVPEAFSASEPYIKEGDEIVGHPLVPVPGCEGETFKNSRPTAIAVDPKGDIYVVVNGCDAILEYAPSGKFIQAFTGAETPGVGESVPGVFGGNISGLAFDPASEHLLVAVRGDEGVNPPAAVDEFDVGSGRFLDQITESAPGVLLHAPLGEVAVDSKGYLYVADPQQGAVDVYDPGVFLPSLKLGEAGSRTRTTAVVHGMVDPEGIKLTACEFQYVSEAAFDSTGFTKLESGGEAPCVPAAAAIEANHVYQPVHAEVSEHILSGTVYRYRLLATSESSGASHGGTAVSGALAFTAPGSCGDLSRARRRTYPRRLSISLQRSTRWARRRATTSNMVPRLPMVRRRRC